jgi:hypothetical protein
MGLQVDWWSVNSDESIGSSAISTVHSFRRTRRRKSPVKETQIWLVQKHRFTRWLVERGFLVTSWVRRRTSYLHSTPVPKYVMKDITGQGAIGGYSWYAEFLNRYPSNEEVALLIGK